MNDVLLCIPLLYVRDTIRLVTDRSPAQVRDEFHGLSNPLTMLVYVQADEGGIDVHEDGASYERTTWFGKRIRIRYETKQQPNGDLVVRFWRNESERMNSTVSIEPADGTRTLVTIHSERLGRISLRLLFQTVVCWIYIKAGFEEYGYGFIEDKTHIRLR
jgi:hypothetical protein